MSGRWAVFLILLVAACVPRLQEVRPNVQTPGISTSSSGTAFVAADGRTLPLRIWRATGDADAPPMVVLALHGFNDYSSSFDAPARWWAERGVTTYAYDQRGFGATEEAGVWAGIEPMVADLRAVTRLLRGRHPQTRFYLLGESMGAAVILSVLGAEPHSEAGLPGVDGAILVAPAVSGRATMNPFYRAGLWVIAHTFPGWRPTGQSFGRVASDNIEMLRALGRDPLVIKKTRFDSVYGLVNLMDRALESAPRIETPLLLVYGERDEIIPKKPTQLLACRLNGVGRVALYSEGYHLLLRDLQAEIVWRDVFAWMAAPEGPLPSRSERAANAIFSSGSPSGACAEG